MKCMKGTCPETGKDPKLTVNILDQESGAVWGFYCNYECALKDMGTVLLHLKNGGDMATVPESTEDTPELMNVEADAPPVAPVPKPAAVAPLAPGFVLPIPDDTWNTNQLLVNDLAIALATELNCIIGPAALGGAQTDQAGKKTMPLHLSAGCTIKLTPAGDNLLIDLGNADYDAIVPPSALTNMDQAIPQLVPHVKSAINESKIAANTPNF